MIKKLPRDLQKILGYTIKGRITPFTRKSKISYVLNERIKLIVDSLPNNKQKYTKEVEWNQWVAQHVGLNYTTPNNSKYAGLMPKSASNLDKPHHLYPAALIGSYTDDAFNMINPKTLGNSNIIYKIWHLLKDLHENSPAKALDYLHDLSKSDAINKLLIDNKLSLNELHPQLINKIVQSCEKQDPQIFLDFAHQYFTSLEHEKNISIDRHGDTNVKFLQNSWLKFKIPLGNSKSTSLPQQREYFGIHAEGMQVGIDLFFMNVPNAHHHNRRPYYKYYSKYHNCSGAATFFLNQGGAQLFSKKDLFDSKLYKISNPEQSLPYLCSLVSAIQNLNQKARAIEQQYACNQHDYINLDHNYLEHREHTTSKVLNRMIVSYNSNLKKIKPLLSN